MNPGRYVLVHLCIVGHYSPGACKDGHPTSGLRDLLQFSLLAQPTEIL